LEEIISMRPETAAAWKSAIRQQLPPDFIRITA
jgi:hypothetical protein